MKKYLSLFMLLILSSPCGFADNGYIYRYKNKEGKIIYSDVLPPNERGEFSVLSTKSGVVKKVVEKELNQEEIQVKQEEQIQQVKTIENNAIQKKKDISLLSTYSNIEEIDKMKKYELDQIDLGIKSNIDNIAILKDKLNILEQNNKNIPNNKNIQEEYQKTAQALETTQQILDSNKKMYAQRESKYNSDKERYILILKEMSATKEKPMN